MQCYSISLISSPSYWPLSSFYSFSDLKEKSKHVADRLRQKVDDLSDRFKHWLDTHGTADETTTSGPLMLVAGAALVAMGVVIGKARSRTVEVEDEVRMYEALI